LKLFTLGEIYLQYDKLTTHLVFLSWEFALFWKYIFHHISIFLKDVKKAKYVLFKMKGIHETKKPKVFSLNSMFIFLYFKIFIQLIYTEVLISEKYFRY